MLIQFNFSNFKSYRKAVSFDMSATSLKDHPYHLINPESDEPHLKSAVIYGANASGKTAVLEAFDFMRRYVLTSFKNENERKSIPVQPFEFDETSRNGKSEFEVFFSYAGKEYQYGFVVDKKRVHSEWLYRRDRRGKNSYKTLFERNTHRIECKNLKEACKFADYVEDATLFLSFISNLKIKDAKNVADWFSSTQVFHFGDADFESFISRFVPISKMKDAAYKEHLEQFLKAIDMGIESISFKEVPRSSQDDDQVAYELYSHHKSLDGKGTRALPFEEESNGTKKMFCLYHHLHEVLTHGRTLWIDELDAKLHPLLLKYVLNLFHHDITNPRGAQLIYTSHENYTLTKEVFRRDQIWFAEKDALGQSSLYSLAEIRLDNEKKVRNDATYNKDYLSGRYGAIPSLKNFYVHDVTPWEDE